MINGIVIPPAGKYVVAVSGGVDSVVMLDILCQIKDLEVIIAHFNHNIREDSDVDEIFVKNIAKKYNLQFESERGCLGPETSEELARKKRYQFLKTVKNKYKAAAIITAHHQDDIIETCFINIIRGTGRRGISSLSSKKGLYRPLLAVSKQQLKDYAAINNLKWREDYTNKDPKYLRNNLRINTLSKISPESRTKILGIIDSTKTINEKIDKEVAILLRRGLHRNQNVLSRSWFVKLSHDISKEVIYAILIKMNVKDVDRKTIEKLVIYIKTLKAGKTVQLSGFKVLITKRSARFIKS